MFPFKPIPKITFWIIFHKRWKFQDISAGLILLSLQTSFCYCNLRVAFDMHKWRWRESSLAQRLLPNLSSIVLKSFSSFIFRGLHFFFSDNRVELSLTMIHLPYGVDFTAIKSFLFFCLLFAYSICSFSLHCEATHLCWDHSSQERENNSPSQNPTPLSEVSLTAGAVSV